MPDFQELMTELGRDIGMPIDDEITRPVEIKIDGFPVVLALDGRSGVEAIVLSAELGTVPEGKALQVYSVMLDANVLWTATADCTLGVNADTRVASICYRSDVDRLDGAGLGRLLAGFVEIARNWANFIAAAIEANDAPLTVDHFSDTLIRI